ncbi:aspartyl protease family protein [bacterium]|nr:aspartyl protease family protein [bacterium]
MKHRHDLPLAVAAAGCLAAALCLSATATATAGTGLRRDGASAPAAVVITGAASTLGVDGPFRLVVASDGRYRLELGGPLPQVTGWDGTTAWDRDWNGTSRPLHLRDRDQAVLDGLFLAGAWPDADDGGRLVWSASVPREGGGVQRPFTHGDRGLHGAADVDAEGRLVAFRVGVGDKLRETAYRGERDFGGVRWPAVVEQTSDSGETVTLRAEEVTVLDAPKAVTAALAPAIGPAADHRFLADLPADLEIFRAPSGHLLVHPLLDGRDVGWFIFDTGAGALCLDNAAADSLGYAGFGEITAKGVGGDVKSAFYRGASLQLGPLVMDDPAYVGLDLQFLSGYFGKPLAGVLGYGVLARAVVEFDHQAPRIALHDRTTYPGTDLTWTPLFLFGRHPCVPGAFEGHDAVFRLDTGADGTLTFHQPTVERLGLLRNRRVQDTQLGGVGGFVAAKKGPVAWVELGGRRFEHVEAAFALAEEGAFADAATDGNVGNELLDDFLLVFDYGGMRMALTPRPGN